MTQYNGFRLVPVDMFRFHYLVYDAAFIKVGSLDYHKGIWLFTQTSNSDTFFGLTRDAALRSWLRSYDDVPPVPCPAPRPFPNLKTTL